MTTPLRPSVLLDRDGVLNKVFVRNGITHPPAHVGELELLPGVVAALQQLRAAGWPMVVVTNQPDVARGVTGREVVEALNGRLRQELPVLDVLTCFHDTKDHCTCRKPKPGLLLEAAKRFAFDLARSWMIGDRWSDVEAGRAAGCRTVLIETPYSGRERCRPDACARDLATAADLVLRQTQGGDV